MSRKLLIYTALTCFFIGNWIVAAENFELPLNVWNQPYQPNYSGSIALQTQKPSLWRAPISFIQNHPYLAGTLFIIAGSVLGINQLAKNMTKLDTEIQKKKDSALCAYYEALYGKDLPNYKDLYNYFTLKKSQYDNAFADKYKENRIKIYGYLLKILLQIK